ncbi:MAG: hypothetical protein KME01_15560 [Chroococcus sp. CMT-3BRIN-NPC107]|jgi:hypothetical protein|nr:hypothetical protein [Chroococcus sp. CMT-3BRIN-NPC107]
MQDLNKSARYLNLQEVYPCPICQVGEIATMPLMEAMACQFCHHIFTANLEKQQLQMADRQPPLTWRWDGKSWSQRRLKDVEIGWGYTLGAIAFVILPTTLIGITVYARPPLLSSPLSWFPVFWMGLTFCLHLGIIAQLVIEFLDFPFWAYLNRKLQSIWQRSG